MKRVAGAVDGVIDLTSDDEECRRPCKRVKLTPIQAVMAASESVDKANDRVERALLAKTKAKVELADARFEVFREYVSVRGHVDVAQAWFDKLKRMAPVQRSSDSDLLPRTGKLPAEPAAVKHCAPCHLCRINTAACFMRKFGRDVSKRISEFACPPQTFPAWQDDEHGDMPADVACMYSLMLSDANLVWYVYLERRFYFGYSVHFSRGFNSASPPSALGLPRPVALCGPCMAIRLILLHKLVEEDAGKRISELSFRGPYEKSLYSMMRQCRTGRGLVPIHLVGGSSDSDSSEDDEDD